MSPDQAELACRIRDIPLLPHFSVWSCSSPWFEMSIPMEQLGSFHKLRRIPFSSARPFYWKRSISAIIKAAGKNNMWYFNFKTKDFNRNSCHLWKKVIWEAEVMANWKRIRCNGRLLSSISVYILMYCFKFQVLKNPFNTQYIQQPIYHSFQMKPKSSPSFGGLPIAELIWMSAPLHLGGDT